MELTKSQKGKLAEAALRRARKLNQKRDTETPANGNLIFFRTGQTQVQLLKLADGYTLNIEVFALVEHGGYLVFTGTVLLQDCDMTLTGDGETVWITLGCNAMPLHDPDAIRGMSDYLGILIPRPGLQVPSGQRLPA